jgi:hypothetical protein
MRDARSTDQRLSRRWNTDQTPITPVFPLFTLGSDPALCSVCSFVAIKQFQSLPQKGPKSAREGHLLPRASFARSPKTKRPKSYAIKPMRVLCNPMHVLCNSMAFLCAFYGISMQFLYSSRVHFSFDTYVFRGDLDFKHAPSKKISPADQPLARTRRANPFPGNSQAFPSVPKHSQMPPSNSQTLPILCLIGFAVKTCRFLEECRDRLAKCSCYTKLVAPRSRARSLFSLQLRSERKMNAPKDIFLFRSCLGPVSILPSSCPRPDFILPSSYATKRRENAANTANSKK